MLAIAQTPQRGGPTKITPLYSLNGEVSFDNFGFSISRMADLNGDGYNEILIGAPNRHPLYYYSGKAYVVSGFDGTVLRMHEGVGYSDRFGHSVSNLPDVNGDGVPDYAVGAIWDSDGIHQGQPGSVTYFSGADGTRLLLQPGFGKFECHGASIAALNDVNGDGVMDYAVGARFGGAIDGVAQTAPGKVRVFSGATKTLLTTTSGDNPGDYLGEALITIPDIDGDGVLDLAAGAYGFPSVSKRGRVELISGKTGNVVRKIDGDANGDWFGWSIAVVPDYDGDGIQDLAIGAPRANNFKGIVTIVSMATGAKLRNIYGAHPNAQFGFSVAALADLDSDGKADLFVGSPFFQNETGRVDVVSAKTGKSMVGLVGAAEGDHFGQTVTNVGDLSGDNHDEVAIGANGAPNGAYIGSVTVVSIR
jgi:hypothetical protein